MEDPAGLSCPLPPVPVCPAQHLLRGQADLHRPALPRYAPRSGEGEEKQPRGAERVGSRGGMAAPQCPPFASTVPGGWCLWSERTACSQPCWGQTRTRSRACTCPVPQHGGVPCPGEAGEAGAQHQRETCASPPECPGEAPLGCSNPNRLGPLGPPKAAG